MQEVGAQHLRRRSSLVPEIRGTVLGGPYSKDDHILGSIVGSPLGFGFELLNS